VNGARGRDALKIPEGKKTDLKYAEVLKGKRIENAPPEVRGHVVVALPSIFSNWGGS